jgi:hypothetical protein
MKQFKLTVPTYYGHVLSADDLHAGHPEFGEPFVPVVVGLADGVRLVLGAHDYDDLNCPDIQIERRPNGWAIFLHPLADSDASGYVYFLDDGRSFLLPELPWGATNVIQVVKSHQDIEEVDWPKPRVASRGSTKPQPAAGSAGVADTEVGKQRTARRFRFEIGADVTFVIEAETKSEARARACVLCDQLGSGDYRIETPFTNNVYVVLDESSPELVEVE